MFYMAIGKRIKEARIAKGLTQEELAKMVGVTKGAIANYENNASHPKEPVMYSLMNTLSVDANFLFQDCVKTKAAPSISDEAAKIAQDYDSLDSWGKAALRGLADNELARMAAPAPAIDAPAPAKIIPLFGNSFAAGAPEPDFGNQWQDYEVPADSKADFAIHINGDSMEPYLPDGSIALGKRGQPADGEVGAFLLDGEYICKQFCQDFVGNIYLFSLNRKRKDADVTIWHDSGRNLSCFGRILMDKKVPLPHD